VQQSPIISVLHVRNNFIKKRVTNGKVKRLYVCRCCIYYLADVKRLPQRLVYQSCYTKRLQI